MTISSVHFSHHAGVAPVADELDEAALGLDGEELYDAISPENAASAGISAEEVGRRARGVRRFLRRRQIVLACASCGGRNYRKTKACREGEPPLRLKKFCSTCSAHTLHREAI